jgi:hypothetical protein
MTTPLRTFPDPKKPKAFYLERVRRHRAADELIRGTGWNGLRGCAIGCTIECYDHSLYPELLGIPTTIARLEDWLFENLPEGHLDWPEQFLAAIPENANLSGVFSDWCVRLLGRCLDRVGNGEEPWRVPIRKAVEDVRRLHETKEPTPETWSQAAEEAANAAEAADLTEAEAATASAWAAADSAWAGAGGSWAIKAGSGGASSAAWSAARPAAWAAWEETGTWEAMAWRARSTEIRQQARDLLELLAAAPCVA